MLLVAFAQAADSYPSHLLPLLAAVLAFAVLLLGRFATAQPRALVSVWRRLRAIRSLAGSLGAAGFAAGLVIASYAALGPPVPRVTDELSYLLAADTFVQGRMANPPAPPGGHFRADNVLDSPTRSSRYPPGQGLVLAGGQKLLGVRWGGLLLSAAAVAAGTVWMLAPWVAPPWPFVGGLLVAAGPAFGSYWSQSYWGGHVAAFGSVLIIGAAGRLRRRVRATSALVLGCGLGLLAASRPWEGLVAGLVTAGWLCLLVLRRPRERAWFAAVKISAMTLLGLAPWLLLLAMHNRAVTGDPWTMPHMLYLAEQGGLPELRFQIPSAAQKARAAVQVVDRRWFDFGAAAGRSARIVYHEVGLPLAAAALGGLAWSLALGRARSSARARPLWHLGLAGLLAVAIAHGMTRSYFPHYSAPAFGFVWLLGIGGARRMGPRGRAGATLAIALLAAQLAYSLAELPAHRPDHLDWSREKERFAEELAAAGGQHLVFVDAPGDWTHNGADLVSEQVLWVSCLGAERDGRLAGSFPERRSWRVVGSASVGRFRLEPYLQNRSQLSSASSPVAK